MYHTFLKRFFDILGALILLPLVLLEVIIFAPLIWLFDKGPVFFNATRAGKGYKPFKMYKLRSMYINSPDIKNPDGSTYNSDHDPRVTPIGRFLRKTSLDELPQILNVLLGDMSFIGPRPKLYVHGRLEGCVDPHFIKSFSVRPGVTGYAQAYYRNSITQEEKLKLDAYYAENISFTLDVRILLKTIVVVLSCVNINNIHSTSEK